MAVWGCRTGATGGRGPLPAGVPYEIRLKAGGSVIYAGMTEVAEPEVFCRLPDKERLVVGQTYVFEAFPGPGTEPNVCEFTIHPDQVLERDVLEVRLPVRKTASGDVLVACEHAVPSCVGRLPVMKFDSKLK